MQDVTMSNPGDSWTSGDAYQKFMGRWSPFLAELFVPWVGAPAGSEWLDVGCGCVRKEAHALENLLGCAEHDSLLQ
jgi:hypothetical protein